ncbi:MAG: hypothetical protein JRF41_14570 [Deltaproteobacteria bacterium]|nr:hypothetical protein [Deltaproteobacteria bacterium]
MPGLPVIIHQLCSFDCVSLQIEHEQSPISGCHGAVHHEMTDHFIRNRYLPPFEAAPKNFCLDLLFPQPDNTDLFSVVFHLNYTSHHRN